MIVASTRQQDKFLRNTVSGKYVTFVPHVHLEPGVIWPVKIHSFPWGLLDLKACDTGFSFDVDNRVLLSTYAVGEVNLRAVW